MSLLASITHRGRLSLNTNCLIKVWWENSFTFTVLLFLCIQQPRKVKRGKMWSHLVKYEQGGDVDLNLRLLCAFFQILLQTYNTCLWASVCSSKHLRYYHICMLGKVTLLRSWLSTNTCKPHRPACGHLCKGAAPVTPQAKCDCIFISEEQISNTNHQQFENLVKKKTLFKVARCYTIQMANGKWHFKNMSAKHCKQYLLWEKPNQVLHLASQHSTQPLPMALLHLIGCDRLCPEAFAGLATAT